MSSATLAVPKGTPTDLTTGLSLTATKSYMLQVIGSGPLYLVEDDDVATAAECIDKGLRVRAGIGSERILDQVVRQGVHPVGRRPRLCRPSSSSRQPDAC